MKLRCMIKTEKGWQRETPEDVSKWMWKHEGCEAVVIDDASHTYYCGTPSMLTTYQEAWEKERRVDDRRKAAMFLALDKQLFAAEG